MRLQSRKSSICIKNKFDMHQQYRGLAKKHNLYRDRQTAGEVREESLPLDAPLLGGQQERCGQVSLFTQRNTWARWKMLGEE